MYKKLIYSIILVILLGVTSIQAGLEPFSIPPIQDVSVCNDPQYPAASGAERGSGMHIRDIADRRRVGIIVFDISEFGGLPVQDVIFNNYGHDGGSVIVYGIIEELDNGIDEATIVWNIAPGVQNDPTPPLNDPIALDYADLTGVLARFDAPGRGQRTSSEPNQALDDFINSDTDGIVAFVFAPPENGSVILRTKELEEGGTYLEGLVVPLPQASKPDPADSEIDVPRDAVLSWRPGRYAGTHNVYLGTDPNDINEASLTDSRNVLLEQNLDDLSFVLPDVLELETIYYWRIDDVNSQEADSPFKGNLWSFTTGNFLVIEDFEDYNDFEPDTIWNTWSDGYGVAANGSTAGYGDPDFPAGEHFLEDEIVYGGSWSMPLVYDNSVGLSEVTRTTPVTDWTQEDMVAFGLWYYGDAANAAEPMYMVLNNTVITNDNPNAALVTEWTDWNIELQTLADQGVNLNNVSSITLGFGNKSNPVAGGSGTVLFDNIRLYRQRCVPNAAKPEYDLNNDCIVNDADLELLMTEHGRSSLTPQDAADIYREAESADSISGSSMEIIDDATASGGQYITGTGSGSSPPTTNVASYNITVDAGTYRIFATTIAPNGSSDSFWLRIQGATTQAIIDDSGWVNWRVMPESTDWTWVTVVSRDAGDSVVEFEMSAGNYTVEIANREDGCQLDNFMLIADPEFEISDLDPLLYDLNGDGTTDDADVALLNEQWLDEILWP